MGFPLISVLGKLVKIAGNVLGVDSVKDVVDAFENNKLTPEQKAALEAGLREHEEAMEQFSLERMKLAVQESVALIQSPDKFVSRARPTMLYAATVVVMFLAVCIGIVLVKHTPIDWGVVGAMTSLLAPLFGAGGYYIGQRTKEKLNGNGD